MSSDITSSSERPLDFGTWKPWSAASTTFTWPSCRAEATVAIAAGDRSTLALVAQLWDRELTPAAAATQREMARRVESAISGLEDQDCEIIIIRHYEQLTNQEAAVALGLSPPAASMRYLRAIRRLRELLGVDSE